MTILQTILEAKITEVENLKKMPKPLPPMTPVPSFYDALQMRETVGVIAEIKRASPSKGIINKDVNPIEQAQRYEGAGAACISVLTDNKFFNGSFEDLQLVTAAVAIPVLCKDFIVDEIQIEHAFSAGAAAVLLIVAALPEAKLKELYEYATALNLDVLVEVHNLAEYTIAKRLKAKLIGINNRDLKTFEVDLAQTQAIGQQIVKTDGEVLISESGVRTEADAHTLEAYGADALLVGETLMLAQNVENTLQAFTIPKTKKVV